MNEGESEGLREILLLRLVRLLEGEQQVLKLRCAVLAAYSRED